MRVKIFFNKLILCIITTVTLVVSKTCVVSASSPYLSYGSIYNTITVQPYSGLNALWVSYIDAGIANWNNSSANVTILTSTGSPNTITAQYILDEWYGINMQNATHYGELLDFQIYINTRTIYNNATNLANFATSTVVHEFGHSFWLCDDPPTSLPSIMNHDRDRNSMTVPQTYDINNINAIYP